MGAELVATIDWSAVGGLTLNILKVAFGLGFVIFVHEGGHFLVAKLCGVKCEKFYVGFDIPMPFGLPSKLWHRQWGETEYGIGVLPLGGYVKMLGQDDNPMNAEEEAERTKLKSDQPASEVAQAKVKLDPRSYTAKTVPQRMAIISAGVIVNLIFAVIFAAFAFRSGVPFTPCEIGRVVSGSPAWEAGLQPGVRIIQIGSDGKKTDKLRFDWDLRQGVAMHDDGSGLALLLRDAAGKESQIIVRPVTASYGVGKSQSSIGIGPASTLELLVPELPDDRPKTVASHRASKPLVSGDEIVRIDGQEMKSGREVMQYLAAHVDQPIKLAVRRQKKTSPVTFEELESVVPPQPVRSIGLVMKHGPITALQPNSPASLAGVLKGDLLLAVNGEPIGDPLLLPAMLRPLQGHECELTLKRAESEVRLKLTPRVPTEFDWEHGIQPTAAMSVESLGLAFTVALEVATVVPNSPAANAGLQPGDTLVGIQSSWKDPNSKRVSGELLNDGDLLTLADVHFSWVNLFERLQEFADDEVVALTYHRGNQVGVAKLQPVDSEFFQPNRWLGLKSRSETHVAATWGEAIQLGARQTWEDATKVFGMVRKLATGQVSLAKLGGLGSIAYVATSEASEGTTRLLIFLTMLSANLAVLNFLPIPALDGGHMMFLLYEGIFRKPVNERIQVTLTIAGVACLLGLMLFVNALDVKRFFF